jgi:phenylacetic acid degradation operon negative regulatory protein
VVSPYEIEEIFPELPGGPSRPPRRQADSTAQGLTTTLVADYTVRTRAWLPAAAIVVLLGESGVSSGGARTAMSRLARRGVLETCRNGRTSSYRLAAASAADLSAGGAWIARSGTETPSWDRHWTLVAFSLPQEERTARRALRGELRWLGFAPLYDGLWVSPDTFNPTVRERLTAVTPGTITVFRASHLELATTANRDPIDAWDVDAIAQNYEMFIQHWTPLRSRVHDGQITGAAAVRARTKIMDSYRRIPLLDPRLPIELMPAGWPRTQAHDIFAEVYDGLAEPAQDHVRAVVARFAEHPPTGIRAHTVAEMSEPSPGGSQIAGQSCLD